MSPPWSLSLSLSQSESESERLPIETQQKFQIDHKTVEPKSFVGGKTQWHQSDFYASQAKAAVLFLSDSQIDLYK